MTMHWVGSLAQDDRSAPSRAGLFGRVLSWAWGVLAIAILMSFWVAGGVQMFNFFKEVFA